MSKESNANMLDPNRFKIAKNMTVMPGGPENNNPMNVTDNASPPGSTEARTICRSNGNDGTTSSAWCFSRSIPWF